MEDRLTPGVYMELGNIEPARYATGRAGELMRLRGVQRVSWWANCRLNRDDLPLRVPDGTLLGMAEVDDGFLPPEPPPGTVAHHFRRHSRPSQGVLTGTPTTGLLVVWVSPKAPERTQELRDWADFVHLRHIAAASVPGFTQITPYDHASESEPRFMHLYELDAEDPEAAFSQMAGHVAARLGGQDSDAFRHWADLRAAGGYIVYVNTFRLLGSQEAKA
ncbi:MAG: hypothetical protein ACYDA2_08970 [Acidimicrobiales bacterium]